MSKPIHRDGQRPASSPSRQPQAGHAEFNPLQWVHYLLRGRYHWAVLLAVALAAGGAYVAHQRVELKYETAGTIQITSWLPRLLYPNEESGRMPNFEQFVESQVRVLRSERVAQMAMNSEAWKGLDRPYTPEGQDEFSRALGVYRSQGEELIRVSFRDPDPEATRVAVRSVIEAYQQLFEESDPGYEHRRMQLLDERRRELANRLSSLRSEINSFGDVFGPEGVRYRHEEARRQVRELEQLVREADLQIQMARKALDEGPPPPAVEELVEEDPELASLKARLESEQLRLKRAQARGLERAAAPIEANIEDVQSQIDAKLASYRDPADAGVWQAEQEGQIDDLVSRKNRLDQLLEQIKPQLAQTAEELAQLERLQADAADVQSQLDQVQSRIQGLNVESAMGDRLQVLSYGESSRRPVNEDEPVKKAMVGGVAGGGLGVGLIMLLGLANPRLRAAADLSATRGSLKVLGMLPELPDRVEDPTHAAIVGPCIHQMRMLLQLEGEGADLRSFVITSPQPAAGKTSLTMALGFSYAAAEARTLLVDFDLAGGGLTRRLDLGRRKRLGRLLQEDGLVTAAQIEQAAGEIDSGKRLGEKLVDRGLIGPEAINRVLELQQRSRAGLLDVLAGESLDHCVVDLSVPNLHLLSVGNATAEHISRVGRAAVQRFLEQVHAQYDVVLIDTGPVPGSVEASLIAAEADRVVLTVSRGDQMLAINRCVTFLSSVGAHTAGIVYNRASLREISRSQHSSYGPRSTQSERAAGNGDVLTGFGRLGSALGAGTNGSSHSNGRR